MEGLGKYKEIDPWAEIIFTVAEYIDHEVKI